MLSFEQISILREILGEPLITKRKQEMNFFCPFCKHHKKKLAVNLNGQWHCWFCEIAGKKPDWIIFKFGTVEQKNRWGATTGRGQVDYSLFEEVFNSLDSKKKIKEEIKIELPREFISLVGNRSLAASPAVSYLRGRGLVELDIIRWKIGYCPCGFYAGRIIIPSFDRDGGLNYFIARTFLKDELTYNNPEREKKNIIFNELRVDFKKPVVLVEGVFDAMKVIGNVIPLLGSKLDETFLLFQEIVRNKTKVYLALDPDARVKEAELEELLKMYGIEVVKIDVRPFKDVGEMTVQEFQRRKDSADLYSEERSFIDKAFELYAV